MLRGPMTQARTERVSPRKLAAAGNQKPISRALCGGAALLALGLVLDLQGIGEQLEPSFAAAFDAAASANPQLGMVAAAWSMAAGALAAILAPVLAALVAGVVLVGIVQLVPTVTLAAKSGERASPFDIARRLQQLFAAERGLDALVSATMVLVLGAVTWLTLAPNVRGVLALSGADPHLAAPKLIELLKTLAFRLVLAAFVLGGLDYLQRRVRHALGLRMTHRELLEEQREQYGDPAVRAERARQRRAADAKARP